MAEDGQRHCLYKLNDRYPLNKEEFGLYYTSVSSDQQTIDVYVEDNFGQTAKLLFEFNSQRDKDKKNPNENKKQTSRPTSLVYLSYFRLSAQDARNALHSLPPFERTVFCIKHFKGLHGCKNAPYVGYSHQLLPEEHFREAMTGQQMNSQIWENLMKRSLYDIQELW